MGGIMSITGQPGGEPTRVGMSIGDIAAGLYTTIGVTSALFDRAQTGAARKVDISMLDCQVGLMENAIVRYFATGEVPGPLGGKHPSITPFQTFPTADGHLIIAAGNDTMYRRLCETIERPDLAEDPRYESNHSRNQNAAALEKELTAMLVTRPTAEWVELLDNAGVPASGINDVTEVVAHPQIGPRNMVVTVEDPVIGELKVAGNPIKLDGYDDPPSRAPAPDLDHDREKILRELEIEPQLQAGD
jgi:CoA:oxalate CoA-transferase